jgi:thiopeptide-type bacteriocin biosynthesis protein
LGKPNSELCSDQQFIERRDAFLDAGLAALNTPRASSLWVHCGLQSAESVPLDEIYRRLARHARELLKHSAVKNFFFMHKPPGFRLRFEITTSDRPAATKMVLGGIEKWKQEGIIDRLIPGIYEPESYLFGGHLSMKYVHELFTIDSLAWLDVHGLACRGREAQLTGPTWALSLLMLRGLFAELGITDFEDLGVWDLVRSKMGRRLPDEVVAGSDFDGTARDIQAAWRGVSVLRDELTAEAREIAERHDKAVRPVARRWVRHYFTSPHATIGPREAAAFYTIFHWNRAALSLTRQAMLVEAVLYRGHLPDANLEHSSR